MNKNVWRITHGKSTRGFHTQNKMNDKNCVTKVEIFVNVKFFFNLLCGQLARVKE